MTLLKKYESLSDQAENIDSYAAYKELIETIRVMNYEELFNIMRDAETALMVIARGEAKGAEPGIGVMIEDMLKLGNYCMENQFKILEPPKPEPYLQYTYEWIEKNPKYDT